MPIVRRLAPLLALTAVLAAPAAASAAFTSEVDPGTKTVHLTGTDANEVLTIRDTGAVLYHSSSNAALESQFDFDTQPGTQNVDADESWQLSIKAGGGDDRIFIETTEVLRVLADLGAGHDSYLGTTASPGVVDEVDGGSGEDRIAAGRAADEMRGGEGNDTLVWNNGDGSDEIDGQDGVDVAEVNGDPVSGDQFVMKPENGRLRLDRVNLGLFHLLIGTTTERLELNGFGGPDTMTAGADIAALGVGLDLNGGSGEDALTGGDGGDLLDGGDDGDTLIGGAGEDRIAGDRGADSMAGGDGDDTLVWRDGDGSDVVDGDGGFDTMAVSGSAAGEDFAIRADGARTSFNRTSPAPFTLDVSAELLDLDAFGGDDTATAGGAPPSFLDLDGGSGADTLTGGAGNDALRGGSGGDTLTGGGGSDVIDGEDGDDTVAARDDAADLVRCGAGNDRATLDASALDAALDCETAERPPASPPVTPPATPAAKAVTILTGKATVKKGRVAIKLGCPAGAATCQGRLTLATPRAVRVGRARVVVVLGSASYRIAPGGTATVRVKLPKSLAAIGGRSRSLKTRATAATAAAGGGTLASSRTVTIRRPRR